MLANDTDGSYGLAIDATSVYWTERDRIRRVPKDGSGPPVTLAAGRSRPSAVTADAAAVYWIEGDTDVQRSPISGGEPVSIATGLGLVAAIAVDSDSVYFATRTSLMSSAKDGSTRGAPTILATGDIVGSLVGSLAIDAANVYWTDGSSGEVKSVPKTGGAAVTLASNEQWPGNVAIDETNVYWTTLCGKVVKVTKPTAR